MRRVVVTGATGFVGRVLVERLRRDGLLGEPVRVVALSRTAPALVDLARAGVETHALDIAEASPEAIAAACGRCALVFHLAANASVASGDDGFRNNVRSTERLLTALRSSGCERLVYASSIGAVDRAPSDDCTAPLDEDAPPHPLTRYGESKLAGERAVAASGLPFAIVRPTWVYGPGMRADSHLRVLLEMVRRGAPVARAAFPGRVSVIHVDDLCTALILAATRPEAAGQTFFAADGEPVSLGALFRLMGDIVGRRAGRLPVPSPVATMARRLRRWLPVAAQNLHSDVLAASVTRLQALGFAPRVSLRTGLVELARSAAPAGARWIVTGAASGIGRALAVQLHAAGHQLVVVDRDAGGLMALLNECAGIATITADLATDEGRAALCQAIDAAPLGGLVNCAGLGARGAVAELPPDRQRALLAVNVIALAEATTHALRRLRQQPQGGTVVNIASSAALQPLPAMAAYAASKAFVLSYSEAVAEEESRGTVRVITVCPGGTDTEFQAASGVKRVAGERLMSAADVASIVGTAIARRRSATLLVGTRTRAMAFMARVLPRRTLVRVWERLMRSLR